MYVKGYKEMHVPIMTCITYQQISCYVSTSVLSLIVLQLMNIGRINIGNKMFYKMAVPPQTYFVLIFYFIIKKPGTCSYPISLFVKIVLSSLIDYYQYNSTLKFKQLLFGMYIFLKHKLHSRYHLLLIQKHLFDELQQLRFAIKNKLFNIFSKCFTYTSIFMFIVSNYIYLFNLYF